MRVDKGRTGWSLLAIKTKTHTVVGRGEEGLLKRSPDLGCDKGGTAKEKWEDNRKDEQKKKKLERVCTVLNTLGDESWRSL